MQNDTHELDVQGDESTTDVPAVRRMSDGGQPDDEAVPAIRRIDETPGDVEGDGDEPGMSHVEGDASETSHVEGDGSETSQVDVSETSEAGEASEAGQTDHRHPSVREVLDDVKAYFADHPETETFAAPTEAFVEESFFSFDYLDGHEELERYWVNEPFAYVSILYDDEKKEYRYHVTEPTLDTFEQYVRQDLVTLLRNSLMYLDVDDEDEDREALFVEQAKELISEHAATVDDGTLHKLLYYLLRDFIHFGPIDPIMRDRDIEDVSCDGVDVPVFVYHREYRDLETNVGFSKRRLNSFTVQLAQRSGKSISVSDPLVDASLPDGSRLQLTLGGDVSTRGSNFTIRKFADIPYTPVDLIRWNTFSVEQMAYFWLAIENNKSLVFAGGTGSGKTTSMNAVSFFIPPTSKVVTIEDTREIDLPHQNWIQSVTRSSASGEGRGEVTMYNLLQAALRQRPEYLLVGEIRTEQRVALTFFQAMGTGHTAYTTLHADSVETVLSRLQNPPLNVPTQMLQDLDIVSIQRQTFIGDRRVRRNAAVAELSVDEDNPNRIATDEMFRWDAADDAHERVGSSGVLYQIARERGWSEEELAEQLEARETVLRYLLDNDILGYTEVSSTIHMFHKDPEYVLARIEADALDPEAIEDVEVGSDRTEAHDDLLDDDEAAEAETWQRLVAEAEAEERRGAGPVGTDVGASGADGGPPADDPATVDAFDGPGEADETAEDWRSDGEER